jgi:uncharacterized lipoprotein NlpE involved in copper resistance
MRKLLSILLLLALLGSCATNKETIDYQVRELSPLWVDVYAGVIPAADGPGIEVQIALYSDDTFSLQYRYIDKEDTIFAHKGNFTWNKSKTIITLDIKDYPPYYQVEDDRLIQLDMKGKRITGPLADYYILKAR